MVHKTATKAFTLIELLIVIAILGVLAVVVLIAIDPGEQLAKTRDSGRKSMIVQLGGALKQYAVAAQGTYPPANVNWAQTLVNAGELNALPPAISAPFSCYGDPTGNNVNNYCYTYWLGIAYVWTKLESKAENRKCNPAPTPPNYVYYGYNTSDNTSCIRCGVYNAACSPTQ